jgi:hypothetical protein
MPTITGLPKITRFDIYPHDGAWVSVTEDGVLSLGRELHEAIKASGFAIVPQAADEIERLRAELRSLADDPYMDPEGTRQHCLRALGQ